MTANGTHSVLEEPLLGKGWRWVWLASPEAREAECEAMGHRVDIVGRDASDRSQAILSLRDADDESHATLHLKNMNLREAVDWDYNEVPERFWDAMDRAVATIGLRLLVGQDPLRAVPDGMHQIEATQMQIRVRNGVFHYDEGPAVQYPNGTRKWYRNGQLHRDDGPAIEWPDGSKSWYRNGQLHRDDGPAVEGANGVKYWYREGREVCPDLTSRADDVCARMMERAKLMAGRDPQTSTESECEATPAFRKG